MICIELNGERHSIEQPQDVQQFLGSLQDLPESFAIAVNEAFVPRSAYADTTINEGDRVELVVPMQGG